MSKRIIPPLIGTKVALRLLEEPDLPLTRQWRNQERIRRWFFDSSIIPPEKHASWFEKYQQRDDDFVFIIEAKDLQRPIGQAAIYNVDWNSRRAEFGRLMIGDGEAVGRGMAREATELLVRAALSNWRLKEVYLEVLATNSHALAIYEHCGFVETGRRGDVVLMSIFHNIGE